MELTIYATGNGFGATADLKSTIELLDNYERAFNQCLKRSCISNRVGLDKVYLRLSSVEPGSLDVGLLTEIAAAVAPLAPHIFGYAWDLYKSAYDLVSIATRHFKEKGHPMTIKTILSKSPGAVVLNVVGGNQVNTTKDILEVARLIHPNFEHIAKLIKKRMADSIRMGVTSSDDRPVLEFNSGNKDRFEMPEMEVFEQSPIEIECEIYRFNKKTLNGSLELEVDNKTRPVPFTVDPTLRDDCIESIKASSLSVIAHREMTINALGESKIKKLHIVKIVPTTSKR